MSRLPQEIRKRADADKSGRTIKDLVLPLFEKALFASSLFLSAALQLTSAPAKCILSSPCIMLQEIRKRADADKSNHLRPGAAAV